MLPTSRAKGKVLRQYKLYCLSMRNGKEGMSSLSAWGVIIPYEDLLKSKKEQSRVPRGIDKFVIGGAELFPSIFKDTYSIIINREKVNISPVVKS